MGGSETAEQRGQSIGNRHFLTTFECTCCVYVPVRGPGFSSNRVPGAVPLGPLLRPNLSSDRCCVPASAPRHATDLNIQKMCGCKVFQVVCPLRAWRTALSVGHVITSAMARLLFITFIRRSIYILYPCICGRMAGGVDCVYMYMF